MHTISEIGTDIIFILLHLLLWLINYHLFNKKIFHPSIAFSLVWFSIITLHFVLKLTLLHEIYPISFQSYIIFFIGTLAFTIGSILSTLQFLMHGSNQSPMLRDANISSEKIGPVLRSILLLIVLIGLPFYIKAAFEIFVQSKADDFLKGLRTEVTFNEVDIGPVKYLVTLSFVVFAVNLYSYFINSRNIYDSVLLALSTITAFAYAFFFTGRSLFLMILAIYIGISYLKSKRFSFKVVFLLMIIFVVSFSIIGLFLYDKGGDANDSISENLKSSSQETGIYIVSSLSALSDELGNNGLQPDYSGETSLRFFVKIFKQVGLIDNKNVQGLIEGYNFIPYPTNVHSIYYPYLKDFGRIYAWLILLVFGFLHTWCYLKAIHFRNMRYTLYFSFLLTPLLISFYQDQYLSLFSYWIQIVFFIEMIIALNKIPKYFTEKI